jgi:hypothetical protein
VAFRAAEPCPPMPGESRCTHDVVGSGCVHAPAVPCHRETVRCSPSGQQHGSILVPASHQSPQLANRRHSHTVLMCRRRGPTTDGFCGASGTMWCRGRRSKDLRLFRQGRLAEIAARTTSRRSALETATVEAAAGAAGVVGRLASVERRRLAVRIGSCDRGLGSADRNSASPTAGPSGG